MNPIDFTQINGKQYQTFAELRSDISWFAHHLKTKTSNSELNKESLVRRANKLTSKVEREIVDLLACNECYERSQDNPVDGFVMPCTKPHILIWSDCTNYGLWPAKLMKLFNNGEKAYVRYFGDHTYAVVPSSKCFIYSEKAPENKHGSAEGETYDLALEVINYQLK